MGAPAATQQPPANYLPQPPMGMPPGLNASPGYDVAPPPNTLNKSPYFDSGPLPGVSPYGPQSSGFYQQPYPQPPQYLPFGSGTTMGPTPQHPAMKDFNFMAPGGQQQQQQQPAPAPQAPQQTGLSRVLDQFLGNTPSGRSQVRMFGGMGVPGLGAGSLGMIDRAIQDSRLPRDYRVPFSNQVGVGFRTPTFNQ